MELSISDITETIFSGPQKNYSAVITRTVFHALDTNNILYLQRNGGNPKFKGQYEYPGGKVDPGDTIFKTQFKENIEETKYNTGRAIRTPITSFLMDYKNGKKALMVVFYHAVQKEFDVTLSDEHKDEKWLSLNHKEKPITPMTANILKHIQDMDVFKNDNNNGRVTEQDKSLEDILCFNPIAH